MAPLLSKKQKVIADGVFKAELNEFLKRALTEGAEKGTQGPGYSGVEIRHTPKCVEVIIHATRPAEFVGDGNERSIQELTSLIRQRFGFAEDALVCHAYRADRGLSASAQCDTLRFKLTSSVMPRKAAQSVIKQAMENGAVGVEVILSGKLKAQRAKAMAFREGYMVKSGNAPNVFVRSATRHVYLRQGVLGVKVLIMCKTDPEGVRGPTVNLPDVVVIQEPKTL